MKMENKHLRLIKPVHTPLNDKECLGMYVRSLWKFPSIVIILRLDENEVFRREGEQL